jgi:hypothetical protein
MVRGFVVVDCERWRKKVRDSGSSWLPCNSSGFKPDATGQRNTAAVRPCSCMVRSSSRCWETSQRPTAPQHKVKEAALLLWTVESSACSSQATKRWYYLRQDPSQLFSGRPSRRDRQLCACPNGCCKLPANLHPLAWQTQSRHQRWEPVH